MIHFQSCVRVTRYLSIREFDSIKIDSAQLTSLGSQKRHLQFYNFTTLLPISGSKSWLDLNIIFHGLITFDVSKCVWWQEALASIRLLPQGVQRVSGWWWWVVVGGLEMMDAKAASHMLSQHFDLSHPPLAQGSSCQQLGTACDSWVTRPPLPVTAPTASQAEHHSIPAPAPVPALSHQPLLLLSPHVL